MTQAIIISCGKKKKFTKLPIEARFLYIGGYFRLCYKYAEFLNKDNIYIYILPSMELLKIQLKLAFTMKVLNAKILA